MHLISAGSRSSRSSVLCGEIAAGPTGTLVLAQETLELFGREPSERAQQSPLVGHGSNVAGSRKTLVPASRHLPWSGSAIRFPNPFWGRKSWFGNSRS